MPLTGILINRNTYPDVVDACDREANINRLAEKEPRTATQVIVKKLRFLISHPELILDHPELKQASVEDVNLSKTATACQGKTHESVPA